MIRIGLLTFALVLALTGFFEEHHFTWCLRLSLQVAVPGLKRLLSGNPVGRQTGGADFFMVKQAYSFSAFLTIDETVARTNRSADFRATLSCVADRPDVG